MVANYANDTVLISADKDYYTAVHNLQVAVNEVDVWTKKWKITTNKAKSIRVDITLRPHPYNPIYLDGQVIPSNTEVKYLVLRLDSECSGYYVTPTSYRSLTNENYSYTPRSFTQYGRTWNSVMGYHCSFQLRDYSNSSKQSSTENHWCNMVC